MFNNCPCCFKLLADIQIPYILAIDKLKSKNLSDQKFNNERKKILDELKLNRYCCRTAVMTFVEHEKVVV